MGLSSMVFGQEPTPGKYVCDIANISARAGPRRLAAGLQGSGISTASNGEHQSLRSDDHDGPEDRWEPSIQLDQEQAIPVREVDTTTHLPLHYDQLMSERRVFCLKSALRPERRGEQGQDEAEQRDHSAPTT
jgi:hypothetical protein